MAAVDEVNSTLAFKCMDFCQALASQGQVINFSLAIGSTFSFSLDTRSKVPGIKKKASPSTLRRNAKRREEFNQRKQQSPSARIPTESDVASSKAPKCDHCEFEAASEKGLRQHVRMKHKPTATELAASPENLREQRESTTSLNCSSLLLNTRDENCQNCEATFSPGHQCSNLFQCDGCEKIFNCEEDLNNHSIRAHPNKCSICKQWFPDYSTTNQHHLNEHENFFSQ